MLKRTLYFIYSIPFNLENVQVYINYPKKKHHEQNILFSSPKTSLDKKYKIVLGSIKLEIEENKDFHITLKIDSNRYKSNHYSFKKNHSFFIYDLKFEPNIKFFKKIFITPPLIDNIQLSFLESYFIFKDNIPEEEFLKFKEDFMKQSFNKFKNEIELNILIIVDIIKECYNFKPLKGLIKELLNIFIWKKRLQKIKNEENILRLRQYKSLIDKIASKDFRMEFKEYFPEQEKKKYFSGFHQIILFSYFKMGEYNEFNNYYFNYEDEFESELNDLYQDLDFFDSDIIISIIEKTKSIIVLKKCLLKSKNIEELLKIIIKENNKINELLLVNKENIIINKLELFETDNIKNIIKLYKEYLNNQKDNNYTIIIEEEIWFNYFDKFKKNNVEKIYELIELPVLNKKNQFLEKLFNAVEETLFFEIENKKLENESCINYLIDKLEKHKEIMKGHLSFVNLEKFLDLSKMEQEFIKIFKESKFDEYFKSINIIIEILIKKTKNLDELYIIFQLFYERINQSYGNFKDKLMVQFNNFFKNLELKDNNYHIVSNNIINFLMLSPIISDDLLKEIENSRNQNDLIIIYQYIMNHFNKQDNVKQHILSYLTGKNVLTIETCAQLFASIDNEKDKIELINCFGKISQRYTKVDDFYEINENVNLQFLNNFIIFGAFNNDKYNDIDYIKKTKQTLLILTTELENFNIKFDKIEKLYSLEKGGKLDERLNIIFFDKKEKIPSYKEVLVKKIQTFLDFLQKLEKVIIYLNACYSKNKNKITLYEEMKNVMNTINLKDSIDYINSKSEINVLYKEALIILKYMDSSIFNYIFSNEKKNENKGDQEILDDTINQFKRIGTNLFTNFEQIPELKKILNLFETREKIINELECLNFILFNNNQKNLETQEIYLYIVKIKEKIMAYIKGCESFIIQFKVNQTEFYDDLKNIENELNDNSIFENLNKIKDDIYKFDSNLIDNFEQSSYINFIIAMFENENFLSFIIPKTEEDIKKIEELVGDIDDEIISETDIKKLIDIITFKEKLIKNNTKNDCEFFQIFKDELLKNEKELLFSLNEISKKFNTIEELFVKAMDTSGYAKMIIHFIILSSEFEIKNDNNEYICLIKYNQNKDNETSIKTKTLREILEIKDKILLRQKVKDKENKREKEIKQFLKIIDEIEKVLELLEGISSKGYIEEINCVIKINNGNEECICNGKDYGSVKELLNNLESIFNEQEKAEKNGYLNLPYLRLLFGKQLSQIYHNLYNKDNKFDLSYIDKFITANNNLKKSNFILTDQNSNLNLYECINEYVKEIFTENKITIEKIFEKSKIKIDGFNGLYTYLSSNQTYEKDTIKATKYLTKNLPCAQTFLLCSSKTRREEIISFIYRAIKCESYTLFVILKPEYLDLEISNFLLTLLEELYLEMDGKIKSCLLFIYLSTTSDLINQIKQIKNHHYFDPADVDFNELIEDENEIEIYYSDASGIGKSELIKKEFNKINDNYKYYYFPIEGDFTKEEILERLKMIKDDAVALHIDILDTNTKELVNIIRDFLFCFLIMKYYSLNYDFIYYGKEFKIKIETPFGFINPFDIYPTLKYFKKVIINREKIPPIIGSPKFDSNFQLVSQYLYYLDNQEINNINIFVYFEKICEDIDKEFKEKTKIGKVENQPEELNKGIYQELEQLEVIDNKTGGELIKKYLSEKENENITFYQLNSFINVLGEQLKFLSGNFFLNSEQLRLSSEQFRKPSLRTIRSFIIESLIKLTKYCTKSAYDSLLNGQIETSKSQSGNFNEDEALKKAMNYLTDKQIISFNELLEKTSIVFLNEDKMTLSIITIKEKNSKEYQQLYDLYNSNNVNGENTNLINYTLLDNKGFLEEINKVFDLNKDIKDLLEVDPNYVFTTDNFIKLILITLKIRAKVPIIMMGETGCGKTSLIRIISKLKGNIMETLNIHAGISNKDIINFVYEKKLIEDDNNKLGENKVTEDDNNKLEENKITENDNNNKLEENKLTENDNNNKLKENKIWVFLDEINTCNSMGLISEMMCKGTIQGKKLKDKVTFIGACNPYRRYEKKIEQIGLVNDKQKVRSLVYSVNPLPHSLLNFVFDFGSLKKEDEEKYIKSMITQPISKYSKDFELLENDDFIQFSINCVIKAQNFIRENNFSSSVSLREVRRYVILFEWFLYFIKENEELFHNILNNYNISIEYSAVLLSIYICYFIRMTDKNLRNQFSELIMKDFNYQKFVKEFQNKIVEDFEIEKGIAKNRILLENLFALFVCINNKIPIIICGKPGCSKSLSIKLIDIAMKGKKSKSPFFQKLPSIKITPYQGSITSTSQGVLEAFNITRNKIPKGENNKNLISVLYFDEMGLAEISPNNPLKVIHSQLEYDENEDSKKIAFVGISNWSLDASKMNRTVFHSVPEPDEDDLKETAIAIADEFENGLGIKYQSIFDNLSKSYFLFKKEVAKSKFDSEFHGTRDFYHLIKIAARNLKNIREDQNPNSIAINSIERNFGGREKSIQTFKSIFSNFQYCDSSDKYDVKNAIENNIKDNQSRFLLIISNSSISQFLIRAILEDLQKKYIFFLGSHFEDDLKNEYYSASIINRIQVATENGNVIIMNNLESIYPSLYDLFNQNFTYISGKKYARIALGYAHDLSVEVNADCRIVVLIDQDQIRNQDPPFLNRFEKHVLSFKDLLTKEQVKLSKDISKILKTLIESNDKKDCKIDLSKQLININKDEIDGLIYNSNKNDFLEIKEEVFKKIIPNFSQDLIAFASNSVFKSKYPIDYQNIISIYNSTEHRSLYHYLENMKNKKNIIYTFSHILDSLMKGLEVKNEIFGTINSNSIYKKIIEENCSEKILEKCIQEFLYNDKYNVLIFQIHAINSEHLNHIQFLYENNLKYDENNNIEKKNKAIIFIIYMKREIKYLPNENPIENTNFISYLSPYDQTFIDNLNGKDILITEILELKNIELYSNPNVYDMDGQFDKLIFPSFTTISYDIDNIIEGVSIDNYYENVVEKLIKNEELKKRIKNKLIDFIDKESQSLLYSTFFGNNFEKTDSDFLSIIRKNLDYTLKLFFIKFIVKAERDGVFPILLQPKSSYQEIEILSEQYLKKIDIKFINVRTQVKENRITTILGLNIPMINESIFKLNSSIEEIKNKYFKLEDDFRNDSIEEEQQQKTNVQEFEIKENRMYQNIKFECERIELFKFIIQRQKDNSLNKEIFSLIQEDFYTIFIIQKFKHKNIKHIREFLNYIISLKFPQSEDISDFFFFSQSILWIKSHEDILNEILRIFDELSQIIPNLLYSIKNIIDDKKIDYSKEKNNEEYKKIINEPFYSLIEAILESIYLSFNNISELNEEKTQQFFESLKSTLQVIFQIRNSLKIVIRGIYILSQIVIISEGLKLIKQRTLEKVNEFIKFITNEINYSKNNSFEDAKNELKNEFEFIKNTFPNDYSNIIVDIYCDKYRQIPAIDFRKSLFEIICDDDSILVKSKILFNLLLKYDDELIPKSSYDIENDENDEEDDENVQEDEKEKEFLSFVDNNNNIILNTINSKKNIIIDEIFLYIYESKINQFFNTIEENNKNIEYKEKELNKYEEKLDSLSYKYLKKSIQFIEEKNELKPLYHLGLIYSIAYLKCYFYNYVDIILNHLDKFGKAETIESYLFEKKIPFRNVIKIYLLKLLFQIHFNDYYSFHDEIGKDKYKNWREIDKIQMENQNEKNNEKNVLEYLFFDLNNIENYRKVSQYFLKNDQKQECIKLINDPINFYSFVDLSINQILSFHIEPEKNIDERLKYLQDILNQKLAHKMNYFSKVLFNKELYNKDLKDKINTIDKLICILTAYKIALQCLSLNNNSFYSQIMGKSCVILLKNSYIPGGQPSFNLLISSYYEIKRDLETKNNPSCGCYICSCNQSYFIDPCGLPNQTFKCNCGEDVGGENHILVEREGHFRVYLNEAQQKSVEARSYYPKKTPIKSMILKDFKKNVVEKEFSQITQGFCNLMDLEDTKNIRNLENFTFSFLNFILFSVFYFNENVNENDFKDKIKSEKSFLDYLLENWNFMSNELKDKNIEIKVFIQQIFPKFFECIQNYENFNTPEKRTEFENKIDTIVKENIEKYDENFNLFKIQNSGLNSISQFEKIMREYKDSLNDEENFPYFKYFTSQSYPNEDHLQKILSKYNDESEFPVLKSFLRYKNDERIEKLQNLIKINPFENQLIKQFSFHISRNEAKQKKIKDVIEQFKLEKLFKDFQEGWDDIYKDIKQYNCQRLTCKEIIKTSPLASVLNDDGELEFGMNIAGAYYYFIEAQNLFIDSVSPYLNKDNILHFFQKQLENSILAQNATKSDIINLSEFNSNEYDTLNDILYQFSFRNCFKDDNSVDYFNYKEIIYDLNSIEEELGKILLVGKRKFLNEQKFIVYEFEAYHGKNSTILNDFIQRYQQIPLTEEQKRNLLNNKGNNSKEFLFSLQMLIFYLNKEGYGNEKGNLTEIINDEEFPSYINLSDDCKTLFNKFTFGVEHLIEIYNYIELLSYGEVLQNVDIKYRDKIDERGQNEIANYFSLENANNYVIKKSILPTVIRKFISRYLSGIREDQEIRPDIDLFDVLKSKMDLWDLVIYEDSRFDQELNDMNDKFRVEVRHSIDLYDVLGGDKQIVDEKLEDVVKAETKEVAKKAKNVAKKKNKKIKE